MKIGFEHVERMKKKDDENDIQREEEYVTEYVSVGRIIIMIGDQKT